MTYFYLVTGFLGSGKTSLLKHILKELASKKRIAVIQNEFAPTSADGAELLTMKEPFKLVEVNNGSVFCVCMLGTFIQTLDKLLKEYHPEMVFLEASGLSDPVNILELLQDVKIKDHIALQHIFAVVDALHFNKGLKMLSRVKHQIMIADTLILNKIDLNTGDLSGIENMLKELNPFAEVVYTKHGKMDVSNILKHGIAEHPAASRFAGKASGSRPPVKACVLRTHDKISLVGLEAFLEELNQICIRVKGFVNLDNGHVTGLQSVFGSTNIKEIPSYNGPTEIVAFGETITPKVLRDLFRHHGNIRNVP